MPLTCIAAIGGELSLLESFSKHIAKPAECVNEQCYIETTGFPAQAQSTSILKRSIAS